MIADAPEQEDDQTGLPFSGEAGQLLDRILFAMKLKRQDVYLSTLVKCRPPVDRELKIDEISACLQILNLQLAAIRPRIIITLGPFSAQTLLQSSDSLEQLRGHWGGYDGIALMPTYHPEYLLQMPAAKRDVWEDMKQVIHRMQS